MQAHHKTIFLKKLNLSWGVKLRSRGGSRPSSLDKASYALDAKVKNAEYKYTIKKIKMNHNAFRLTAGYACQPQAV